MGGWVGQMMMFDDKVGGWGWLNDDVINKYTRKKNFCLRAQKPRLYFLCSLIQVTDFVSGKMNQNYYVACSFFFQ